MFIVFLKKKNILESKYTTLLRMQNSIPPIIINNHLFYGI